MMPRLSRRLRIVLLCLAVALAFPAGYLLYRYLQYRQFSDVDLGRLAPKGTDFILRAPNAERHWARLRAHPVVAAVLALARAGSPKDSETSTAVSLESLIHELSGGQMELPHGLSEERLFSVLGRDALVAGNPSRSGNLPDVLLATRIPFRYFLLEPLVPWLLPRLTGSSLSSQRRFGVSVNSFSQNGSSLHFAFLADIVLASTQESLLERALERALSDESDAEPSPEDWGSNREGTKGTLKGAEGTAEDGRIAARLTANIRTLLGTVEGQRLRRILDLSPLAESLFLLHPGAFEELESHLDWDPEALALDAKVRFQPSELPAYLASSYQVAMEAAARKDFALLRGLPKSVCAVFEARVDSLGCWDHFRTLVESPSRGCVVPEWEAPVRNFFSHVRDAMRRMESRGARLRLLPQLGPEAAIVVSNETYQTMGEEQGLPGLSLLAAIADAAEARRLFEEAVEISETRTVGGHDVHLLLEETPFGQGILPCYAVTNDRLVVSSSFDFVRTLLEAEAASPSGASSPGRRRDTLDEDADFRQTIQGSGNLARFHVRFGELERAILRCADNAAGFATDALRVSLRPRLEQEESERQRKLNPGKPVRVEAAKIDELYNQRIHSDEKRWKHRIEKFAHTLGRLRSIELTADVSKDALRVRTTIRARVK